MDLSAPFDQLRRLIEIQRLISVTDGFIRTGMDFNHQAIRSCRHCREPDVHHVTTQSHSMRWIGNHRQM